MVTVKQSQKIVGWCLESALGLIFDMCERAGERLYKKELHDYFVKNGNNDTDRKRISRVTYELKRQKYIEVGEGDSIKLTDKAKIKLIDKYLDLHKPDGKRRLVSFDIPEVKRRQRNAFRKSIKKLGFHQIQKSLWVSTQNVGDLVDSASREFGVHEYVAYFVIESSNIEKYIDQVLTDI